MWRHEVFAVVAALLMAAPAVAQDEGVKQVQQLVKRANSTVGAINEAKLQIQKTMAAYDTVLAADTKDRRGAYKKLQKEMANTEKNGWTSPSVRRR
jgi:predicted TPR repeat methyltransferase